ncbi:terminase small subunit [Deinococcus rufus]|uniref:Terminase small subunit n=1 Tax=Deinococcus rufus TaxID=2136097 RepID=A0ABV7Z8X6_9DEIO
MPRDKTPSTRRAPKRGTGPPTPAPPAPKSRTPAVQAELTEAAQDFADALKQCSPQERVFVLAKLDGYNNADAARKARYSAKTAKEQGSRLLTRVHVDEAIRAGWTARGFGPQATMAGISELVDFDPGEVTSYVNETVQDWQEVPVRDVLRDVAAELEVVAGMLAELPPAPVKVGRRKPPPDDFGLEREFLEKQQQGLRRRQIELEVALRKDPDATVLEHTTRLKRVPFVDLEKVQESGKQKFIEGVEQTRNGRNIKLISRFNILDMAARVHGLYRNNLALTGPDGGPIRTRREDVNLLEDLDDEGLDALEAALERRRAPADPG